MAFFKYLLKLHAPRVHRVLRDLWRWVCSLRWRAAAVRPAFVSSVRARVRARRMRRSVVFLHHSYYHFYYLAQALRSEEHTSELQSQSNLVCRLLLEKKKER